MALRLVMKKTLEEILARVHPQELGLERCGNGYCLDMAQAMNYLRVRLCGGAVTPFVEGATALYRLLELHPEKVSGGDEVFKSYLRECVEQGVHLQAPDGEEVADNLIAISKQLQACWNYQERRDDALGGTGSPNRRQYAGSGLGAPRRDSFLNRSPFRL